MATLVVVVFAPFAGFHASESIPFITFFANAADMLGFLVNVAQISDVFFLEEEMEVVQGD